jgi:hypothetical protein
VAATDHAKRFGRVEDGCARNKSYRFFSSVDNITDLLADSKTGTDDIRINLILCRISTHSKDTILRLDMHSRIGRQERNSQRRNSNTQVHIISRLQLFGSSSCDTVPSLLSFIRSLGWAIISVVSQLENLDILLRGRGNDSIDENSRKVDIVGVDFPSFDNVFGFDDGELGSLGHERTESFCRISNLSAKNSIEASYLPENTITLLVDLPSSYNRNVAFESCLHEECSAVEFASFSLSAFFHNGA